MMNTNRKIWAHMLYIEIYPFKKMNRKRYAMDLNLLI